MSQNTLVIADGTGAQVLDRMNNAYNTLATLNSGSTAPSTTYAYMLWADTANNLLKMRNAANTGWNTVGSFDSTSFNANLINTGVTANTYGSATKIPSLTVNSKGQITSASEFTFSNTYIGGRGQVFDTGCTFTASKSTTVLTVTAVQKGTLYVGQTIYYNNSSMTITSFGTGTGGTGTYNVSVSGTVSSRPWSGNGTGTFTIPTGITTVKVTVVGGGGAGGNSGAQQIGTGGGGGGNAVKYLTGLTPEATISVVCGYASGTSSATYGATTISATGGASGGAVTVNGGNGNGGAGGLGSGGDANGNGQPGGNVMGGAGSGCTYAYNYQSSPNMGGSTILSGGANGTVTNSAGAQVLFGGAGGGGSYSYDSTGRFGGMGAPGVVIIEW